MAFFEKMLKALQAYYVKQKKKEVDGKTIDPNSYIDVDIEIPEGYNGMLLTVRAKFDASAASGLRVLYLYSHDGVNYDTEEEAVNAMNYFEMFKKGSEIQRSEIVPTISDYVRIRLRNLDPDYSITNVTVWRVLIR